MTTIATCETCNRFGKVDLASLETIMSRHDGEGRDWSASKILRCRECRLLFHWSESHEHGGFMDPGHDYEGTFRLTPHDALAALDGHTEPAAIAAREELVARLPSILADLAAWMVAAPRGALRRYALLSLTRPAAESSEHLEALWQHADPVVRAEAVYEMMNSAFGFMSAPTAKERAAALLRERSPMPVLASVLREPNEAGAQAGDATTTHEVAFRMAGWGAMNKLAAGDELVSVLLEALIDPVRTRDAAKVLVRIASNEPERVSAIRASLDAVPLNLRSHPELVDLSKRLA